jgi:hypothetical protein
MSGFPYCGGSMESGPLMPGDTTLCFNAPLLVYVHEIFLCYCNYYYCTKHQSMQGIQRRHEVHIGSTRKGQQNLGQQLGKGFNYSMASSVGTASPARNTLPLTRASKPPLA